jgi:hypothetical protein
MCSLSHRIMRSIRARYGRGKRVFSPKNFLQLGTRAAVDQALSRLAKKGILRRVSRGLYDLPRFSDILKRPAPVSIDSVVNTIAQRDRIQVMPDGIVAANNLGLTNAVPAKNAYITNGSSRTLKIGNRTVFLRHVGAPLIKWAGRPGAQVVQALFWLGKAAASDPQVTSTLRSRLPDSVKQDLIKDIDDLPRKWMATIVRSINLDPSVAM